MYPSAAWSSSRVNRRPRTRGYSRAPWSRTTIPAVRAFLAAGANAASMSSNSASTRSVRWCARIPGGQTTSAKRRATRRTRALSGGSGRAVGTEDGPANLGPPFRLVRRVAGAAQVVLAERPVDADLVRGGVRAELGVTEVRVGKRAVVADDSEFGRRDDQRRHPPDGPDVPLDRDEHADLAAVALEQLAGENPAGGPGRVQSLGADGGAQLTERALPPGQRVGPVDHRLDGRRRRSGHAAVLECRRPVRRLQQVAQRLDRGPGLGQLGFEPA